MPKFRKKNYHRPGSNKKLKKVDKPKNSDSSTKKNKNLKFIKRSKESEDLQRRQKIIEEKYRENLKVKYDDEDEDLFGEDELNPLETLLSTFKTNDCAKNNLKSKATESSSDEFSESEEDADEEKDDMSDDINGEEVDDENNSIDYEKEQSVEGDLETMEEEEDSDITEDETDDEDNIYSDEEKNVNETTSKEDVEEIVEQEIDEELEKQEIIKTYSNTDPYSIHLECNLSQEHVDNLLLKQPKTKKDNINWPELGNIQIDISNKNIENENKNNKAILLGEEEIFASEGETPALTKKDDISKSFIKPQLIKSIHDCSIELNPLELELFSIFNNYQDLFYPQRKFENCENIRKVYCLHILNHMLKTRTKILHHNAKLADSNNRNTNSDLYRDQGLVRPKILLIMPFRESAFLTVNLLIKLFFGKEADNAKTNGNVINYSRFLEEFTGDTLRFPKTNPKPEDYEKIFSGNTDDTFRIGISLTKKCIKLYTEFYSSDILLASPLGLRMIIGAAGDAERDYDYLNSIEILILDQTDVLFAQNWDHVLHIMDHLHLQPQQSRNTDFSRVREWYLNGLAKFYRQTLLFSSHELPEFRSLHNSKCFNYRGKLRTVNPIVIGSIRNVLPQIAQVFHKIDVKSIQESFDIRFKYFTTEILPQFKSSSMSHCMIYVPSYFDFVRLRNYFKKENISFVQICEYTTDAKIARARDMFFHSAAHFLLYSERAHFFRRTRIKGIRHLIMYQPPYWPNFYSEMINLMQTGYQNGRDGLESSMSITILYTKYDILQISGIIGTKRANKMIQSSKQTFMFTTEDN